uniref:Lipid droplet-associated hydrolase n=1 Tax=Meloidogyne enterolobii TaxID=390850 RepID=A0A6V7TXM8_MELEN|nr:unnamed protein product [Meloidogyne enterolobii]
MASLPHIETFTQWVTLACGVKVRFTRMEFNWDDFDDEGSFDANQDQTIFLCIPGNPGNDQFYKVFGGFLLRAFALGSAYKHIKFFSIAHANHVPLPPGISENDPQCNRRFNLDEQIHIKMRFIDEYLHTIIGPKKARIFLIGHSIGAYIALKLLPKLLNDGWDCVVCYCLFPTVEDMDLTPNGIRMGPIVKFVNRLDSIFKWIFSLINWFIPQSFKRWIVRKNFGELMANSNVEAGVELINPLVFRNIVHMTFHELEQVRNFDDSLLAEPQKHYVMFFYGQEDGWVPVEFAARMKMRAPRGTLQVLIDQRSEIDHAFVLKNSRQMAERLNRLIMTKLGIFNF